MRALNCRTGSAAKKNRKQKKEHPEPGLSPLQPEMYSGHWYLFLQLLSCSFPLTVLQKTECSLPPAIFPPGRHPPSIRRQSHLSPIRSGHLHRGFSGLFQLSGLFAPGFSRRKGFFLLFSSMNRIVKNHIQHTCHLLLSAEKILL